MKIAISGLHGQGKTTLISALKQLNEFKNFTFVNSPTRTIANTYNINEAGTQDTQVAIMMQHYLNQIQNNIILDRCALDGLAYSKYFEHTMSVSIIHSMLSLYRYLIQQYDLIFYTEPEIPLISDGTRSINMPFFEAVKQNFEYLIKEDKIKIISLSGTVQQRVNKVIDTYKIYLETHKK